VRLPDSISRYLSAGLITDLALRLRRSLRAKLILTFSAVIIAGVALSAAAGIALIGTAILRQAQDRVRQDLSGLVEQYHKEGELIGSAVELAVQGVEPGLWRDAAVRQGLAGQLEKLRQAKGLDYLTLADEKGKVMLRVRNPQVFGDVYQNDLAKWVQWSKKTVISSERFTREQLLREGGDMAERARVMTVRTPGSVDRPESEETNGLVLMAAAPVLDPQRRIEGILYGGILVNNTSDLVDRAKRILYREESFQGRDLGGVTIFLDDYRVATNVPMSDGRRALGTRVSEEVYRRVIERGSRWTGRAFVVEAWRIAAYEPIRDISGKPIGMLYAGVLEAPFTRLRNRIVMLYLAIALLTVLGLAVTANLAAGRVLRPVRELVAATGEIARGNLEHRVKPRSGDEIGRLGDSFNRMAGELKRATEGYRELNQSLEQRVRDRTRELDEARDQLLQTEKLSSLGKMAAGIAHEINNPLTSILLNSHLMEERLPKNSRLRENLALVIGETERCSAIVKGMLEFARQTVPNMRPVDLNGAIGKTLLLMESQMLVQQVAVNARLDRSLPRVPADEGKLRQVFANIILNAADAMAGGGTLDVATRLDAERRSVEISFRDSGGGIPRELLTRVFDPFFSTKGTRGTGLGLAISYGIIQQHGGGITAVSEEGKGTTFTITLPIDRKKA